MTEVELQMKEFHDKEELQEEVVNVGQENPSEAEKGINQKGKKPRKIMHFSDGILEEYSTDEEEEDKPDASSLVDPKTLKWGSWMYYWMLYTGSSALAACDYVGESLANLLGITSPKYQYEINEYKRCEKEERALKEEEEAQMAGWTTTAAATLSDGIKHKIVASSTIHQPPSLSHTDEQPDNQLPFKRSIELNEVPSHASSSSSSSTMPSSPSHNTTKIKFWMSKVHMNQVTEMSTWV